MKKQINNDFISADINMDAGATALDGTDFTSLEVPMNGAETIQVQIEAKGANAAMSGSLTAYFGLSPGSVFDTFYDTSQPYASVALTLTTDELERHTEQIDVRGGHDIKLLALVNSDGAHGVTDVNVHYGRLINMEA